MFRYCKLTSNMKVLVYDTETTGLPAKKNACIYDTHLWPYIVQLGYAIYDTEKQEFTKIFDNIVISDNIKYLTPESEKIHNITKQDIIERGVPIEEVLDEFYHDYHSVDLIVCHNIKFDKSVVLVECVRNKKVLLPDVPEICTMVEGTDICKIERENKMGKYYKYPRLEELHYYYFKNDGLMNNINLHNAFVDILVTLRCFMKMKYNTDVRIESREFRGLIRKYTK